MNSNQPIKAALLFPGQGAQYVGMGKQLAQSFPKAAAVFQEANDVLGFDLRKICFEGPAQELVLTQNSQPALLVTSIACWEVLKEQGLSLEIVGAAGLSLGEYSALVVAGSLRFADALLLVRARGIFMQEACDKEPSAMASIMGLDFQAVEALCKRIGGNGSGKILDIANVNCPGQIVVSGHREAVTTACEQVSAMEGARGIALNVSGAFHSRLMQSAADKLQAELKHFHFAEPHFSVFGNVTGVRISGPEVMADLLARQVVSSVLWEQCVRSLLALKPDLFLEIGSGKVLSGLLRKIDRGAKSSNVEDGESLRKTMDQITLLREGC